MELDFQVIIDEIADEIETFFASCMNHSIIMNLKLSIEQIHIKSNMDLEGLEHCHIFGNRIRSVGMLKKEKEMLAVLNQEDASLDWTRSSSYTLNGIAKKA